ncbi:uncharacterized protein LOC115682591 isoform X2 [Syzygium oleosum]|uniref:uncharacterized protein LOC115682591 isoform X2 n=1 Tax=Syzygium oleosum TaxID=219896 RepID=UPI0024BAF51E|nr:uncharacterized protein LOC115682591 isoform X2 [Syzygium oleosum]
MAVDAAADSSIPSPSPSSHSIPRRRWWICWAWRVSGRACRWRCAAAPATSSTPSAAPSPTSLSSLWPLCDLAEAERALVLNGFRQSTLHWNQIVAQSGNDIKAVEDVEQKSHIVVVTDACLPLLASGELPLSARVLINYELPTKKETYMRRMAACLAADGIVINMIVGGEVVTLKSLEESSNIFIAEMPINISEIL